MQLQQIGFLLLLLECVMKVLCILTVYKEDMHNYRCKEN